VSDSSQLEELTLRQLRLVAQQYRVSRYSRMTKQELIEGILAAQAQESRGKVLGSQEEVQASKYQNGGTTLSEFLDIDAELGDLPAGYGESRVVLLPRDPQWAFAYWDVSNEHKEELRRQGGQHLALRLYDVTNIFFDGFNAHTMIEFPCDELAREWYVPIPVSDRDFILEIGYITTTGAWLTLARSAAIKVPPMYPSDWVDDYFVSIPFDQSLVNKTFSPPTAPLATTAALGVSPSLANTSTTPAAPQPPTLSTPRSTHDAVYTYVANFNTQAGSVDVPGVGGFFSESGSGLGFLGEQQAFAVPGVTAPLPALSLFSGIFSAEFFSGALAAPESARKRGFWLVADAELIIYGATEPDATVTLAGETIKLNPDGTFRFHYQFPDGLRESPIVATAIDGEQKRSITMRFMRQTPERHTNTKAEMVLSAY